MDFTIETEQEEDGRWIAEICEIPGALSYGDSKTDALQKVEALALRVLAERIEQGEQPVQPISIRFDAA
jgi:predicted RNase H-like HicB family nuclease